MKKAKKCVTIIKARLKGKRKMREKEIAEIRRRYRSDRSNISRICGCYVDSKKEIISEFDQSLGLMSEEDAN